MNHDQYEDQAYGTPGRGLDAQRDRLTGGLTREPIFMGPQHSGFWLVALSSMAITLLAMCAGAVFIDADGWPLIGWSFLLAGVPWFLAGWLGTAVSRWRRMNYRYQYPRDLEERQ